MPRTRTALAAVSLLALTAPAGAQEKPPAGQKPEAKQAAPAGGRRPRAEADPAAAQRRALAVSLLTSLANDARSFRDETMRARAQARAADALWETDAELARTLFRRAWDAAVAADRESERKQEEERRAQLSKHGSAVMASPPELRAEVLRLAGRRERALGEEFLKQLAGPETTEADSGGGAVKTPPTEPSPDAAQRLGLAQELLAEGDVERALQFAEPALGRATMAGVSFLSALRERDAAGADRRFAALVSASAADPAADANTASLLASYAFTPFMFFRAYRGGGTGISSTRSGVAAPDLSPPLRAGLLRAAAQILLRPPTPQDYEQTSAGRAGAYLIIRRLLPLFDRYAPDLSPALNARAAALSADVPERLRGPGMDRTLARGIVPEDPAREGARDEVRDALERASKATGADERDAIYANLAVSAAWRGDARAQEFADKIVDLDLLRRTRAFVDFGAARAALEKKDAEAAAERARKGDLTRLQRVWVLESAAALLDAADRGRAGLLLEEAADEARRIDNTDPDRARSLVAVATRYEKGDRGRAWELLQEALKAANAAEGFTGEDGKMTVQFRSKSGAWITDFAVPEFDLAGILGAFAAEDLERAVQLAQGFTNETARTSAVLAVARPVLLKKR